MARRRDSEFLKQMKEELRNLQQQRKGIQTMEEDRDLVQDIAEMTRDDDLAKVRNLVRGSLDQVEKKIQERIPVIRKTSSPSKRPNLPDLVPGTIQKTEQSLPEAPSECRERLLKTVMTKLQENAQSRLANAVWDRSAKPQTANYSSNTGFYEYQYGGFDGPRNISSGSADLKLKKLTRATLPTVSVAAAPEIRRRNSTFQDASTQPEGNPLRMDDIADVVGEILQEEMNQWIGDFQVPILQNANRNLSSPRHNGTSVYALDSHDGCLLTVRDVGTQARPKASETTTQTDYRIPHKDIAVTRHKIASSATQTSVEEEKASIPEEWLPLNLTEDRGVNTQLVELHSAGTQYEESRTREDSDHGQLVEELMIDDEPLTEPRTLQVQPEPPIDIASFFAGRSRLSSLSSDLESVAGKEAPLEEASTQNTSESHSSGLTSSRRDLSPGQLEPYADSIIDTTFSISEGEVIFYQHVPRLPVDGASEGEVSEGQRSSSDLNRTYTAGSSNPVAQTFSAGELRFTDLSTADDLTTEFD